MPELPEVETVRSGLAPRLVGRRLDSVTFRREDLRWPIPCDAIAGLAGSDVEEVSRRSKYVLVRFSGPSRPHLLIHLGMSGRLFLDEDVREDPEWRLHEHWRMGFGDRVLRYVDPRRFGALDLCDEADLGEHPLLAHLGPEPFADAFSAEYLFERSRGRKVATKVFLMDAKIVVGVGNIYASEACFHAGVRPSRPAGRLRRTDCERLAESIRGVLAAAIAAGGTTLRDYVGVTEDTGYFQRELRVYGRADEPCGVCGTPIRSAVLGQRSTFHCPTCQP